METREKIAVLRKYLSTKIQHTHIYTFNVISKMFFLYFNSLLLVISYDFNLKKVNEIFEKLFHQFFDYVFYFNLFTFWFEPKTARAQLFTSPISMSCILLIVQVHKYISYNV